MAVNLLIPGVATAIKVGSKLKKLYEERKKTYSLADFRVNSNSKDKDRIVKAIKKIYENR